jgi:hypothetical protein
LFLLAEEKKLTENGRTRLGFIFQRILFLMKSKCFDNLHGFFILSIEFRFPVETREMSEENRSIPFGHEIIGQRIAQRRGEREEKNEIDKDRRHRSIELLVECSEGVIDKHRCPTQEEFHDDHNQ